MLISFFIWYGAGGYFSVGERNSFSYGYALSDSKGNHNSSDGTADQTNSISHEYTLGHDFIVNELGYSGSFEFDRSTESLKLIKLRISDSQIILIDIILFFCTLLLKLIVKLLMWH